MSIDFKGSHYPKDVILYAVFFYVRYAVSYRDLEKIMAERGVRIDHATLNRWVVKYSPDLARITRIRKQSTARFWRMDETYIKVKGIGIGLLISRGKRLISCCPGNEIRLRIGVSSSVQSRQMAFQSAL